MVSERLNTLVRGRIERTYLDRDDGYWADLVLSEFAFLEARGGRLAAIAFHQKGDSITYEGPWGSVVLELAPDNHPDGTWIDASANLKSAFWLVKFLEDVGYTGPRHFDAHAYRTEDYAGVRDFARGCMRTYLILKERAAQWNAEAEIQALVAELGTRGPRGLGYERLDQLTIELLLGVRKEEA